MKRLLALTLFVLLILSAVPAAGAAQFTDAAEVRITASEAVEILSDLGIVSGFPDGSFQPDGALTRAQAAKILCCAALGVKSAEALSATGPAFSDVPASHWANPFVEFCASKSIVAGVGGGRFNPDGTLTGVAFGKMLLVALGADAKPLTGAGWDENVKKQLAARHLDYGVTVDGSGIDRQSACRLALNALFDGEAKNAENTLAYQNFGIHREQIGLHAVYYRRPVFAYYSSAADEYWPGNRLELTASPVYIHPTGAINGDLFVRFLGVTELTEGQLDIYYSGIRRNAAGSRMKDIWHSGSKSFYEFSGDGIRLEFYHDARKNIYTVLHIPTYCAKITAASAPVLNTDGTVQMPGSVTFAGCAPCESNAFRPSDVGSYGLYRGNSDRDWRICTRPVEAIRGTVITGRLTAYEPMRMAAIDGKTYFYPYQDLVARGAEKVVFEDNASIGDVLHALIDENNFCYAVWK